MKRWWHSRVSNDWIEGRPEWGHVIILGGAALGVLLVLAWLAG